MNSEVKRVTACIILSDILVYWFCLISGGYLNAYLKLGSWWGKPVFYDFNGLNLFLYFFALTWTMISIIGFFWIKSVVEEENKQQ